MPDKEDEEISSQTVKLLEAESRFSRLVFVGQLLICAVAIGALDHWDWLSACLAFVTGLFTQRYYMDRKMLASARRIFNEEN